jgi:YHS domain-containing protein
MRTPKLFAFIATGLMAAAALPSVAHDKTDAVYTGTFSNVALDGYDSVGYFTQGRPVLGNAQFKTVYKGAEFRFASAANLAKFKANPAAYAPQYGGYCAWAVSQGYTASGDPKVWKIVGGKLYVNYNREIGNKWEKNIPGFIASANKNWPKILAS